MEETGEEAEPDEITINIDILSIEGNALVPPPVTNRTSSMEVQRGSVSSLAVNLSESVNIRMFLPDSKGTEVQRRATPPFKLQISLSSQTSGEITVRGSKIDSAAPLDEHENLDNDEVVISISVNDNYARMRQDSKLLPEFLRPQVEMNMLKRQLTGGTEEPAPGASPSLVTPPTVALQDHDKPLRLQMRDGEDHSLVDLAIRLQKRNPKKNTIWKFVNK